MRHLGGALGEVPDGAGVLARLEGEYAVSAMATPMAPGQAEATREHLEQVVAALAPWATGGSYLNFTERPGAVLSAFRGQDLARLRRVKAQVDPGNLFRAGHQIDPLA